MSSMFDDLSDELFQILKGSGRTLTLYGENGNRTYEPKNARRVFAEPDKMMVSVNEQGSDSEVKVYLSSSTDIRAISKLIKTLRSVTSRYNVILNVRKFGRELKPKDFAYQSSVNEASMWGSAKSSYQRFGDTKLIVRHCQPVIEGVIGSRGRNILSMFVETKDGERFRFPENHLSAGRAFAQHINQGGKPHDQIGMDLATLALESLQLARVSRYIHHSRNLLGEQAVAIRPVIKTRINELRKNFLSMTRPRGYQKIKEAGLPRNLTTLNESADLDLSSLSALLQINSNHALAETLLPVALLLGENMNNNINEMFNGVINLGESELDALVEALGTEYGYDSDSWTQLGEGIGFADQTIFEDAKDFLEIMEAAYQINEEDAITNYATQWTNARHRLSGEPGEMDKDQRAGVSELADGLRKILSGQIDMPDYPWDQEPAFRDENARIRFFLDLFVGQHKLANAATLNYVSSIIDKMAESQKLDSAEKTIAMALYKAMEADIDLGEGIVDESSYDDDPHYVDPKYESALENIVDNFDIQAYLSDAHPYIIQNEEKDEVLDRAFMLKELDSFIAYDMDAEGFQAVKGSFKNEAAAVFEKVKEFCEARGYHFDDIVKEFAETEDKPEHHGVAAGDHVSTDMGPGQVVSVEGDIAVVEFLHGGKKTLHIDDLDKVPELAEHNEEGELSEWFKSFTPESVLGMGQLDEFASNPYTEGKMARQAGQSRDDNPYNPDGQDGFAWARGHAGMSDPHATDVDEDRVDELSKDTLDRYTSKASDRRSKAIQTTDQDGYIKAKRSDSMTDDDKQELRKRSRGMDSVRTRMANEEELNELSKDKIGDYFNRAAGDRSRAERSGDDEKLSRRDRGLTRAFRKMREEMVAEGYPVHTHDLSDIFNTLHKKANDMFTNPENYGMDKPGYDDTAEAEMDNINKISNTLASELKDAILDAYYSKDSDDDDKHQMEGLDEASADVYHSVFVRNPDGVYVHHFDADNADDAKEEKDYLKNQGDQPLVIKVPKAQANWGQGDGQTDPDAFVKAHLTSKSKPAMGGDQGQNLINQTKFVPGQEVTEANEFSDYSDEDLEKALHGSAMSVSRSSNAWRNRAQKEMDKRAHKRSMTSGSQGVAEAADMTYRTELANLLKNANFRK